MTVGACDKSQTRLSDRVCTAHGKEYTGNGYAITPDRIITAAHVIDDVISDLHDAVADTACCITLFFGTQEEKIDAVVYVECSGRDCGVDAAVLRCNLPASLYPTHRLFTAPPSTPIGWFAQGYTDFGDEKRLGGKDAYEGRLTVFSHDELTVPLECWGGLIDSKQWAGGSGSLAFDVKTARTALAVITKYQSGKMDDQLRGSVIRVFSACTNSCGHVTPIVRCLWVTTRRLLLQLARLFAA